MANRPQDGSYQRQEALSEQRDLQVQRRVAQNQLRDLAATQRSPTPTDIRNERRRKKFVDGEVAVRREGHLKFIETLERSGDHRNARLWRGELLRLRETVEREFPPN